jgi:hypothetical protein
MDAVSQFSQAPTQRKVAAKLPPAALTTTAEPPPAAKPLVSDALDLRRADPTGILANPAALKALESRIIVSNYACNTELDHPYRMCFRRSVIDLERTKGEWSFDTKFPFVHRRSVPDNLYRWGYMRLTEAIDFLNQHPGKQIQVAVQQRERWFNAFSGHWYEYPTIRHADCKTPESVVQFIDKMERAYLKD